MRYSDLFYQKNQNEILKIKISNEDRYLIKKEVPIGVIWRGDNESSAFYAFLANLNSGIIQSEELKRMHSKLHDKIEKADSLKLTISPLLNIVESGWYQVFYQNENVITYNFHQNYDFKSKRSCIWVDDTILPTQDLNALDNERVEFYKKLIEKGKRPTILTIAIANFENLTSNDFQENYEEGARINYIIDEAFYCINPQFIIDGHHKAKAYIEMKEKPSIVTLVRLQFKNENEEFLNIKNYYKREVEKNNGIKID